MPKTDWSMIGQVAGGEEAQAAVLEQLVRRYWGAVYAYIRASGHDVHTSADLTQGFIAEVVLSRGLFESADQLRGRFRSLLMSALQNYLRQEYRRTSAQKRQPVSGPPMSLDTAQIDEQMESAKHSPESAFTAQWTLALVNRVVDRLRRECRVEGLETHWDVFEHRVIRPMLEGVEVLPYPALVERFNLDYTAQAATMMVSIKRRFARELMNEIANTVPKNIPPEDELTALLHDLERA